MSSQEDDPGAIWGPEENEQDQQPFPGHTWGSQEDEQDQHPYPASTTKTSGNRGGANPLPPKGPNQQQNILSSKQRFVKFLESISFILVPLVFAILIFFFTLLFAIRNHVFLPPLALAMLLLALGVMQGALLYYIDTSKNQVSKEMYWNLTVILGFALFLVVGTLAIFGFGASIFFLILLLLAGVFVVTRAIHRVPEGSIDITTLFDKYVRTLQPGPHVLWPLEHCIRLSTKEREWKSPLLEMKIQRDAHGSEYDVHLVATLWYQIDADSENAHNAKLNVKDWETSVQEKFVSALRDVFREVTPDEVKSWQIRAQVQPAGAPNATSSITEITLEEITNLIKDLTQQEVDDWGVKVHKVYIQDIVLIPSMAPRPNPTRPVADTQSEPGTTNRAADQPQFIPEYPPHSESEIEMLKEAYEAVRKGQVTDPQTIRAIAARFEEHLFDPYLDFYPLRVAEILYSRARWYEEQNYLSYLKHSFPDEHIVSGPIEENPTEESLHFTPEPFSSWLPGEYPTIELLSPKPPSQYPMEITPSVPILVGDGDEFEREGAFAWIFAIKKLNAYLLWFLMVLEITLLVEFFLTLIGANQNNLFVGFINVLTFIPLYPFNGIVLGTKLEPSGLVIEWSTLIAMAVYFLAFIVLRIFLHILISSPEEPNEDFDVKPPTAFASKFAVAQVRSFYQNTRRQFKSWLFFSVFAIILGTLCIVSIYLIPYLGKFFPISESTTTVVIILIAAGSLYSIALLSFLQNRAATKQVDSYYIDKLTEAEKISRLTKLASRTPVSESQERINEKIITQILLPLDKEMIGQETFNTVSDEILTLEQKNK